MDKDERKEPEFMGFLQDRAANLDIFFDPGQTVEQPRELPAIDVQAGQYQFYLDDDFSDENTVTFHHDGKVSTFDKRALIALIWGDDNA